MRLERREQRWGVVKVRKMIITRSLCPDPELSEEPLLSSMAPPRFMRRNSNWTRME